MELFIAFLYLLGGFFILLVGGEGLVRSAISMAVRFKVSPSIIGLTIIAGGTSAPELVTSLIASFKGSSDIALGNVVGSNIFNIFAILGLTSLLNVNKIEKSMLKFEAPALLFFSIALVLVGLNGRIGKIEGIVFIVMLVGFLVSSVFIAKKNFVEQEDDLTTLKHPIMDVLFLCGGLGLLVGGANLALEGGIAIGKLAGLSDRVIGVTIISIGTGLPELATSAVASFRGRNDIAVSNVIGSNIMNTLGVAGATAVVNPLSVSRQLILQDGAWMIVATVALILAFLMGRLQMSRVAGFGFLSSYVAYIVVLLNR